MNLLKNMIKLLGMGYTLNRKKKPGRTSWHWRSDLINKGYWMSVPAAEKLSFPDDTFDVVINRHLLWTLPHPDKAINEWNRVLKSGGQVVILDGNFKNYNLYRKLWRYCISVPLILITERKNPFHKRYSKDLEQQLPMRQKERPHADIDLLNSAGFRDIGVVNETVARTYSFLDHLKYGYWGGHFLVKGVKQ
ncbi:MAG: methyltransferase domain-containing protein [Deltaproteobacteria bacterium]|nr:methyltransferase domain-containing protein [Deltaproteobacteria bacterium]